jgi:3-methyladenine DNA glycosylase AlkD
VSPPAAAPVSAVTAAASQFVAAHRGRAEALGDDLATLVNDPIAFVDALAAGFEGIADPLVPDGIRSVTPGLGAVIGVRNPLLGAVHRRFARGTRRARSSQVLACTAKLLESEAAEMRWFGISNLERLLATDPEATWELMRSVAAAAHEWITVDTLAHPYGAGILRDPGRWIELERLIDSPSRWERRLVGSTVATMPFVKSVSGGRDQEARTKGLALVGRLMGDPEPDVQKALSWALRNLAALDRPAVVAFVDVEAEKARNSGDGNRAWVIRDSLSKLSEADAARLRARLGGIRRGSRGSSASAAGNAPAASSRKASTPLPAVRARSSAT